MKIKTVTTPPKYEVSRHQKIGLLYDIDDIEELTSLLKNVFILNLSSPESTIERLFYSLNNLKKSMQELVEPLAIGKVPNLSKPLQQMLNSNLSTTLDTTAKLQLKDNRYLLRPTYPMIQINPHQLYFSPELKQLKSQVYGSNTINWGLQFSYPQLFKDQETGNVTSTLLQNSDLPNTQLFKNLQKWVRRNTKPATFIYNHQNISSSFRISKRAYKWISQHPQLRSCNLDIAPISN